MSSTVIVGSIYVNQPLADILQGVFVVKDVSLRYFGAVADHVVGTVRVRMGAQKCLNRPFVLRDRLRGLRNSPGG